jgi:hypothetical protein
VPVHLQTAGNPALFDIPHEVSNGMNSTSPLWTMYVALAKCPVPPKPRTPPPPLPSPHCLPPSTLLRRQAQKPCGCAFASLGVGVYGGVGGQRALGVWQLQSTLVSTQVGEVQRACLVHACVCACTTVCASRCVRVHLLLRFKQCGESWSGDELGTCSQTICSAGCAMSSVAMILNSRGDAAK